MSWSGPQGACGYCHESPCRCTTVTHLAGPHVKVSGRTVQRCCLCGEKLCDSLNTSMPLNPDGTPPEFPVWEGGALIRIDGNAHIRVGHWDTDELPQDFCLPLVE